MYDLKRRIHARLRENLPVAGVLLLLLSGQGIVCVSGVAFFSFVCAVLMLWVTVRGMGLGGILRLMAPFFLGGASMYLALPDYPPVPAFDAAITVRVITEPRRRHPGSLEFTGFITEVQAFPGLKGRAGLFRGRDLPWLGADSLKEGDIRAARVKCSALSFSHNPFSRESALLRSGISFECRIKYLAKMRYSVSGMVLKIREKMMEQISLVLGNNEDTGLLLSMFIGAGDTLGDEVEQAFKETGLTHVLVVSGYQVTLLYYFIQAACFSLLVRAGSFPRFFSVRLISEIAGLITAILYVFLTGCDAATVRAGVAITLLVAGKILECRRGMLHSVLVSLLLICIARPGSFLDPGTQLTYAALFGICLGVREYDSLFMQYLRTCTFASLFTSLVSLCWFGIFAPIAFLLNPLLAAPVSALVCKGSVFGYLLLISGIDGNGCLLHLLRNLLHGFKWIVILASDIPGAWFECGIVTRILAASGISALLAGAVYRSAAASILFNIRAVHK